MAITTHLPALGEHDELNGIAPLWSATYVKWCGSHLMQIGLI